MARLKGWRTKVLGPLTLAVVLLFWRGLSVSPSEVKAFTEPVIQHSALECIPNNQFALASALIEPGQEIRNARVYFRSDKYPDFYYVDMNGIGNDFKAILPMPSEETQLIIYYVEAVSNSFDSARTEEHEPIVAEEDECKRRDPIAAWFVGDDPGIVVGATVAGAPQIPPGFQAVGVSGFITAAGVASSAGGAGGGIGAGTVAVIGAGAGGAVAVAAVAAGGGGDSTTTTAGAAGPAPPTTTTTTPGATTTAAGGPDPVPVACFTIDPPTATVKVGENIKLDARCSKGDHALAGDSIAFYEWDLGDGRIRSGPDLAFISPQWNRAGVYTITLTVTDDGGSGYGIAQQEAPLRDSVSHTITVLDEVTACFEATPTFMCGMTFDGTCSTGAIASYTWILDVDGVMGTPITSYQEIVSHTFGACPGSIVVQLTVDGVGGGEDTTRQTVFVPYLQRTLSSEDQHPTSFVSYLGVAPFDGNVRGQVSMNGLRMDSTDNSVPFQHQVPGRVGDNAVEAYTTTPMAEEPGFWRFDFSGAAGFVPGSIKVQSGQVTSVSANIVIFRLSGTAGERIQFTYRLLP